MTRFVLVALAIAALASPVEAAAPASKKAEADAEALILEGVKLRKVGRDDAALEKFDRAYGLNPTPRAAAQKGLCLQALGRWTDAEDLLAAALEGTDDAWVTRNRATIKDSLEEVKTKIGRFEITGSPVGAQVFVDGRSVGQLPLPGMVRINAGPASLEVSAEGHVSENTSLQVQGGSFRRLEYRLKPTPKVAAVPMPKQDIAEADVQAAAPAVEPSEDAPFYKRGWFWGVVGAVVVAGVVTAVVLSSGGGETVGPKVDDQVGL